MTTQPTEEAEVSEFSEELGKELGEAQASEGYACSCGFQTLDQKEFSKHCFINSRNKAEHRSFGRVNFQTGEIIMPPAKQRTKEQRRLAKYGNIVEKPLGKDQPRTISTFKPAETLASATMLRAIPKVYTFPYTPIMRAGHQAVIELWGWPEDTPFGEIVDRIFHDWFKGKGVTLAGYIIEETPEQTERRLAALAALKGNGGNIINEETKEETS